MFFYEGYSCPVCGQAFTENDDIVACPSCGAPHHRACWEQEGHCHFADRHGTPEQWSREQPDESSVADRPDNADTTVYTVCPHCGQNNSVFAEFCSRCGSKLQAKDWTSSGGRQTTPPNQDSFPPYSGTYREYRPFNAAPPVQDAIPDSVDLNGVSAGEMRQFIGQNASYYLPRFLKMAQNGSSVHWNGAAFLLTPYWLWYRKQYLAGTLVLLFQILHSAFTAFFLYVYVGMDSAGSYESAVNAVMQAMNTPTGSRLLLVMYLLLFLEFLLHLCFGLLGNYFYYRLGRRRIRRLREKSAFTSPAQVGGASFILGAGAYFISYFVSVLINLIFL